MGKKEVMLLKGKHAPFFLDRFRRGRFVGYKVEYPLRYIFERGNKEKKNSY